LLEEGKRLKTGKHTDTAAGALFHQWKGKLSDIPLLQCTTHTRYMGKG